MQAITTGYIQLTEEVALLVLFYNPLIFLAAFAFLIIQHSSWRLETRREFYIPTSITSEPAVEENMLSPPNPFPDATNIRICCFDHGFIYLHDHDPQVFQSPFSKKTLWILLYNGYCSMALDIEHYSCSCWKPRYYLCLVKLYR